MFKKYLLVILMNILQDFSGELISLMGNDISLNDVNVLNQFSDTIYSRTIQRNFLSNFLLNNQNVNNIVNTTLNEEPKYKNVLSDKGKKKLKYRKYRKGACSNDTCAITQEKFKTYESIIVLPCSHGFKEDVMEWLEKEQAECPMCRMKLDSKEIKNENIEESDSIQNSRENLLNSLNILTEITNPSRNVRLNFNFHPFGTNQIFNTIPHSYINDIYQNEEEMINEAILNSLSDISNN